MSGKRDKLQQWSTSQLEHPLSISHSLAHISGCKSGNGNLQTNKQTKQPTRSRFHRSNRIRAPCESSGAELSLNPTKLFQISRSSRRSKNQLIHNLAPRWLILLLCGGFWSMRSIAPFSSPSPPPPRLPIVMLCSLPEYWPAEPS